MKHFDRKTRTSSCKQYFKVGLSALHGNPVSSLLTLSAIHGNPVSILLTFSAIHGNPVSILVALSAYTVTLPAAYSP